MSRSSHHFQTNDNLNQDLPPPYVPAPEASAPPEEPEQPLLHLSYDQIVLWWNGLTDAERQNMKSITVDNKALAIKDQVAKIRQDYKACYPKEYFPKKVCLDDQICVSDYYVMYHFCDELESSPKYPWFNAAVRTAFDIPPPPYEENEEQPPSYEAATGWWNQQSEAQRNEIRERAAHFELSDIRREYRPYYRQRLRDNRFDRFDRNHFDFYDYYLMSRYSRRLYFSSSFDDFLYFERMRLAVDLTVRALPYVARAGVSLVRGVVNTVGAVGQFAGDIGRNALSGSGSSNSNKDSKGAGEVLIGLAILSAIIATVASAVVGAYYMGIKALSSLSNLLTGKKLLRSIWRLGCTATGAYFGVVEGMVLGALAGSVVPGLGTLAGAIIGAIFGSTILGALGAAFGKYSAELVSWLFNADNPDVLSATNPDKWNVLKIAQSLHENGVELDKDSLKSMLIQLREQKNELRSESYLTSPVAGTEANTEKNRYNKLLEAIKEGQDPRSAVRVDNSSRFQWNEQAHQFTKEVCEMPEPIGLKL